MKYLYRPTRTFPYRERPESFYWPPFRLIVGTVKGAVKEGFSKWCDDPTLSQSSETIVSLVRYAATRQYGMDVGPRFLSFLLMVALQIMAMLFVAWLASKLARAFISACFYMPP